MERNELQLSPREIELLNIAVQHFAACEVVPAERLATDWRETATAAPTWSVNTEDGDHTADLNKIAGEYERRAASLRDDLNLMCSALAIVQEQNRQEQTHHVDPATSDIKDLRDLTDPNWIRYKFTPANDSQNSEYSTLVRMARDLEAQVQFCRMAGIDWHVISDTIGQP